VLTPPSREELVEAIRDLSANMIGAASAYRKYARRYKGRGPPDPFFSTRADDFDKASERAIAICQRLVTE
jgi:hypothetical protein